MKDTAKRKRIIKWIIIWVLLCIFGVYCYFENTIIEVNNISISDEKIPDSFDGYKIVQISDLHNKRFGKNQNKLISKVKSSKPDVIVVTGDLVDSTDTDIDVAMEFIDEAVEIAPVYYVTGNHEEMMDDYDELEKSLVNVGVEVLSNEKISLENNGEMLNLVGLNDGSISQSMLDTMRIDKDKYTILLAHRPEEFDLYVKNDIDLVFTGHAHGGQFVIPFVGGVVAPNQGLFPKYTSGVYKKKDTNMVVSRGIGNSVIPIRINNNPEIIVVTLKSE